MLSKSKLGVLIALFSVAALSVFAQVSVGYVNIVNITDCDFTVNGSTVNCPTCDTCGQTCQSGCGSCAAAEVSTITNYCLVQDVKGNVTVTLNSAQIDADNDGTIDYTFAGSQTKAKLKIKTAKIAGDCGSCPSTSEAIYLSFKTKLLDGCSKKKVGEVKTSMIITYMWAGENNCSQYAISVVEDFNLNIKSSCDNACGYKNKFTVCDLFYSNIPHGIIYDAGCWSGDICGKGAKASGTVLIAETWTEDAKVTAAWNGSKGKFTLKSKNLSVNYSATAASGCGDCGCGSLKGNAKVGYGTTNLIKNPADWCEKLTDCDIMDLLIPTDTDCCNQCDNECDSCNECDTCNECDSCNTCGS